MYVWLGHFAVQQKLTAHCKSTIIEKILKKIFGGLFRAIPEAHGGSQARAGAVVAGLHHCHSNLGSKPCLQPTPQQHWILNPLSEARDQTHVLMDASQVR